MSYKNLFLLSSIFFYLCLSQYSRTQYLMFLTTNLPPYPISSSNSNLLLAGPTNSLVIDFKQDKTESALAEYHQMCQMVKLGDNILPRIFKSISKKIYFYCAATTEILLLADDPQFTIVKRILLPSVPVFSEVKFIEDKTNKIGILGISCSLSALTRCSSSYFIQLDANQDLIISSHAISGEDSEVILDIAFMENDGILKLGYKNAGMNSLWSLYHDNRKIKSFTLWEEDSTNFINKISVINNKKQVLIGFPKSIFAITLETQPVILQINSSPSSILGDIQTQNFFIFDENMLVFHDENSQTINLFKIGLDSYEKLLSYPVASPSKYFIKPVTNFIPFDEKKLLFSGIGSSYYYIFDFNIPLSQDPVVEYLPFAENIQGIYKLLDSVYSSEIVQYDHTSLLSMDSKFAKRIEHYDTVKVIIDAFIPNLIWKVGYMFGDQNNCYLDTTDHLGTIIVHHPLPLHFCNVSTDFQIFIKSNPLNIWDIEILSIELEYPGRIMHYSSGWREFDLSKNSFLSEILYTKISEEIIDRIFKFDFEEETLYLYGVDDLGDDNQFAFGIKCHMNEELICEKDIDILQSANKINLIDLAYDTIGILAYKSSSNSTLIETVQVGNSNSFISEQEVSFRISQTVIISQLNENFWFIVTDDNDVYKGYVETGASLRPMHCLKCSSHEAKIIGISDASNETIALKCQDHSSIKFEFFNMSN